MVTWNDNLKFYTKTFDVLHDYLNAKVTGATPVDTVLKSLSVQMVEKLHINLIVCIDLIPMVAEHSEKFLPYGLVLRGMVSDIINYRYLLQVNEVAGQDVFENEVRVLDLSFVKAYQSFIESEKKLGGADAEMGKIINEKFKEGFKEFFNGDDLIKEKELRTDEMMKPIRDYIKEAGLVNPNISQESGKLEFIKDKNIEQLKITYKYLSQLQHFSSQAHHFYKTENYQNFNPHFSLLVIFVTIKALVPIIKNVAEDIDAIKELVGIAVEISKLTHQ